MKYTFPVIQNIKDVLPAIQNLPEFVVAEKEHYTVLSYNMVNGEFTFPTIINSNDYVHEHKLRRECRGLIFCSKTGNLLSRGYHKFFNENEREETKNIDLSKPHIILEKLDGSMVRPLYLGKYKRPRWITKMGITSVSMQVENWLAEQVISEARTKYEDFSYMLHIAGFTPIFEWCSRKQRIVLDYPEDTLYLTGIRYNYTGEYVPYAKMVELANEAKIPVVQPVSMSFLEKEGIEGIVIRFDDGHMVKVKTDWYVLRHKALDGLRSEKNVVKLILDNGIDDVLPLLDDQTREYLLGYVDRFWANIYAVAREAEEYFLNIGGLDRKMFAALVKNSKFPWLLFKLYDGKDSVETIKNFISKNLQSQNTVDAIRPLIGATWYA